MVTKDEALKIALDYVLRTTYWTEGRDRHDTLKAIKEALAQPEQEPVAFDNCRAERICRSWCGNSACASHWVDAAPPKRPGVGLTDEEIAEIVIEMNGNEPNAPFWRDLARAIEAALGIKE